MSEPIFSDALERFFARLPAHYQTMDERQNYVLKRFFAGMLAQQQKVVTTRDAIDYDSERAPGDLSALIDIAQMPTSWLNWRAQLSGIYNLSLYPIDQRRQVLSQIGYNGLKGTAASMARAVQPFLTGSRYVNVHPRTAASNAIGGGSMWDVLVVTRADETQKNNAPRVFAETNVPSIWTNKDATLVRPREVDDPRFGGSALEFVSGSDGVASITTKRLTSRPITVTATDPHVAFVEVDTTGVAGPPRYEITSYNAAGNPIGSPLTGFMTGESEPTSTTSKVRVNFTPPAGAETITFNFNIATQAPGTKVRIGRFGVRLGVSTAWVAETVDIPAIIEKANVKPAGIVVRHATYETSWDVIEALAPTWNNWESRTWDGLEGLGS